MTAAFGELHELAGALAAHRVILDGELVCRRLTPDVAQRPNWWHRQHVHDETGASHRLVVKVIEAGR